MYLKKLFKNTKFLLLLILILAAGLRFWDITNIGIDQWDEGEYLDAGESVLEGKFEWIGVGFKPLHNAAMTAGIFIFGNYDFSGFIMVASLGVLTVLLVYLLGRRFFDEKTALLAAFILAITEYHIYFSRALYSDALAAFLFSFTILLYFISTQKRGILYPILTGIFIGICFTVRISMLSLFLVILLLEIIFAIKDRAFFSKALFKQRALRLILILAVSCSIIFFVYMAYTAFAPQNLVEAQFSINIGQASSFSLEYSTFYLEQLVILGSPLLLLGFFLGLCKCLKDRKNGDIIILAWSLFIIIVFSLYSFKRYRVFVIALPVVVLLASRGIWMLKSARFGNKIVAVLITLLAVTSLFAAYDTVTASSTAYREAADFVRSDGGQGVITSQLGIFQYYSDETPLPVIFFDNLNNSASEIEKLYNQGYSHLILDYRAMQWNDLAVEIVNSTEPAKKIDNRATLFDPLVANPGRIEDFERMRADEKYYYVYVYKLSEMFFHINE